MQPVVTISAHMVFWVVRIRLLATEERHTLSDDTSAVEANQPGGEWEEAARTDYDRVWRAAEVAGRNEDAALVFGTLI